MTRNSKEIRPILVAACLSLASGMLLCLGISLVSPSAQAQVNHLICVPFPDPCPYSCPGGTQCDYILNGWKWGTCTGNPITMGCWSGSLGCGNEVDCANPPNLTGGNSCSQGVYQICHN